MAQWLWQYSGNTHQTKVEDREQQLRHAVDVLATKETPDDRLASMQTVLRFADRLHRARIRAVTARIASLDPTDTDLLDATRRKLEQLKAGGVQPVLREFQVNIELD